MDESEIDEEYEQQRLAEKQAVQEQIRQAFDATEYPGDDNLLQSIHDEEFFRGIVGKQWQYLTADFIEYNYCDLDFLTDTAYRYYFPAWMIQSLENIDGSMVTITTSGHLLCGYKNPESSSRFIRCIEPMSYVQKQAIRAYLEYFRYGVDDPNDENVQALNEYWRQFAD